MSDNQCSNCGSNNIKWSANFQDRDGTYKTLWFCNDCGNTDIKRMKSGGHAPPPFTPQASEKLRDVATSWNRLNEEIRVEILQDTNVPQEFIDFTKRLDWWEIESKYPEIADSIGGQYFNDSKYEQMFSNPQQEKDHMINITNTDDIYTLTDLVGESKAREDSSRMVEPEIDYEEQDYEELTALLDQDPYSYLENRSEDMNIEDIADRLGNTGVSLSFPKNYNRYEVPSNKNWEDILTSEEFSLNNWQPDLMLHTNKNESHTDSCEECGKMFIGNPHDLQEREEQHMRETGHNTFDSQDIGKEANQQTDVFDYFNEAEVDNDVVFDDDDIMDCDICGDRFDLEKKDMKDMADHLLEHGIVVQNTYGEAYGEDYRYDWENEYFNLIGIYFEDWESVVELRTLLTRINLLTETIKQDQTNFDSWSMIGRYAEDIEPEFSASKDDQQFPEQALLKLEKLSGRVESRVAEREAEIKQDLDKLQHDLGEVKTKAMEAFPDSEELRSEIIRISNELERLEYELRDIESRDFEPKRSEFGKYPEPAKYHLRKEIEELEEKLYLMQREFTNIEQFGIYDPLKVDDVSADKYGVPYSAYQTSTGFYDGESKASETYQVIWKLDGEDGYFETDDIEEAKDKAKDMEGDVMLGDELVWSFYELLGYHDDPADESVKKLQNENKMCNDCMKNFLSEASKR